MITRQLNILPLEGPLPPYIQVTDKRGWGGTWCSKCIFRVLEQEVFGFLSPVPIRQLKGLGLRIDPTHLIWLNHPVVVLRQSHRETCGICDFGKLPAGQLRQSVAVIRKRIRKSTRPRTGDLARVIRKRVDQ